MGKPTMDYKESELLLLREWMMRDWDCWGSHCGNITEAQGTKGIKPWSTLQMEKQQDMQYSITPKMTITKDYVQKHICSCATFLWESVLTLMIGSGILLLFLSPFKNSFFKTESPAISISELAFPQWLEKKKCKLLFYT